ncbi:hypothetical protein [Leucobacter japonicus]|uniref:hypothetical protein n=1 Tax=Leucobacter japonicus TaxID=1461259 RepID=UPI0006A7713F|nr:hypothetical protein [Leucobacter japonicus]
MNTEQMPDGAEAARARLHPALAAAMHAERTPTPEAAVPEAERSMLAVHRDPSLPSHDQTERDIPDVDAAESETPEAETEARRRTQVRWVRPSELAMQGGARATGWGLDLRAELAQRLRDARTVRKQDRTERRAERSERASRLPDLSIAGRRRNAQRPELARSGMGLR